MDNLAAVVEKASKDQAYALELAQKFMRIGQDGGNVRGPDKAEAWRDLLQDFASTPEELARLVNESTSEIAGRTWTTTTTATATCALLTTAGPLTVTSITTVTITQEA
ncbi:hypothetical protein [Massilia sp. PWRC2]|uniref:hypothetical protein n=1 Tax=Massilia sp. PWRC2 TaxID=2804626 RepID=UPI003CEA6BE1